MEIEGEGGIGERLEEVLTIKATKGAQSFEDSVCSKLVELGFDGFEREVSETERSGVVRM